MVTLKDFVELTNNEIGNNTSPIKLPVSQIKSGVMATITPSVAYLSCLSTNDVEKFSKNVADLISSKEFIEPLSDEIGIPKDGENEEEFVARAKSAMETMLRKKLLGKG